MLKCWEEENKTGPCLENRELLANPVCPIWLAGGNQAAAIIS